MNLPHSILSLTLLHLKPHTHKCNLAQQHFITKHSPHSHAPAPGMCVSASSRCPSCALDPAPCCTGASLTHRWPPVSNKDTHKARSALSREGACAIGPAPCCMGASLTRHWPPVSNKDKNRCWFLHQTGCKLTHTSVPSVRVDVTAAHSTSCE